jgi:hypothetical protein
MDSARRAGSFRPYELDEDDEDQDEDGAAQEPRIALTALGQQAVKLWLPRARAYFRGWPPETPDVDDVIT